MTGQDITRFHTKRHLANLRRILLSLMTLGLLGTAAVAQADGGFTAESLAGTWAFTADGTIVPPAVPSATPVALVGIATFEENGQCSLTDFLNIGGTSFTTTSITCTLTVNADGTGTLEADFGGLFSPEVLNIVAVNKDELLVVRTDAIVARGSFKRQAHDEDDDSDSDSDY